MGIPLFIKPDMKAWLASFHFKTSFRTRFSETDAYGHINNVSYFAYFEQARLDYFAHLELFKQLQVMKSHLDPNSKHLVVTANLECNYLSQLFYGQNIDVYVRTARIGKSSFDLEYAVLDQKENTLVAVGRGSIVYVNRETNKSESLPEAFKKQLAKYEDIDHENNAE